MFDHVNNTLIREYLVNGSMDPDFHADVLSLTQQAYAEDTNNEDVPFDVLEVRQRCLFDALDTFNLEGDLEETHAALCGYWSN